MGRFRAFLFRVVGTFRGRRFDRDLDSGIQGHLDMLADHYAEKRTRAKRPGWRRGAASAASSR